MELSWGGMRLTSEALRRRLKAMEDADCEKVELLDLYNNRITWVPSEVWRRFPNLLDLDLSNNDLQFVPSQLGKIRFESLYTTGNPALPASLQRDCVTLEASAVLVSDAIGVNRPRDRARRGAMQLLLANRFDEGSLVHWQKVPVDVARLVAMKLMTDF